MSCSSSALCLLFHAGSFYYYCNVTKRDCLHFGTCQHFLRKSRVCSCPGPLSSHLCGADTVRAPGRQTRACAWHRRGRGHLSTSVLRLWLCHGREAAGCVGEHPRTRCEGVRVCAHACVPGCQQVPVKAGLPLSGGHGCGSGAGPDSSTPSPS